jgi:hypothetical protein
MAKTKTLKLFNNTSQTGMQRQVFTINGRRLMPGTSMIVDAHNVPPIVAAWSEAGFITIVEEEPVAKKPVEKVLENEPETEAEAEPETKAEAEPETEAEAEPETEAVDDKAANKAKSKKTAKAKK